MIKNLLGTGKISVSPDTNNQTANIGLLPLTRADVGLSNVNNTADDQKPISTATQTALDNKQDKLIFDAPGGGVSLYTVVDNVKHIKGLTSSNNITLTSVPGSIQIGFDPTGLSLSSGLTTNTITPLDSTANLLSMAGSMNIAGSLNVNGTLVCQNNLNMNTGKTMHVDYLEGAGSMYGVMVKDRFNVGAFESYKPFFVYGNTELNGTLTVNGASTFNDNVSVATGKSINVLEIGRAHV